MQVIFGILGFIFIFGLAVLVHELGHFLTARKFGVLCHEFAIGMGPILWKKRKGDTLYTLRAIPIGGFVSMGMLENERDIFKEETEIGLTLDNDGHVIKFHFQPEEGQIAGTVMCNSIDVCTNLEVAIDVAGERKIYPVDRDAWYIDTKADREAKIVPSDKMLEQKTKLQRFIIMASGAVMNFILAYVLALIVGFIGGEVVGMTVEPNVVVPGQPAYIAGLRAGDIIQEIDGIEITEVGDIIGAIQSAGSREIIVVFEREGAINETTMQAVEQDGTYRIGLEGFTIRLITGERSIAGSFREANTRWTEGAMMIVNSLRMLATREIGVDQLAGVVGIVHMTSEVALLGIVNLLLFASVININLGIFNLLPFPGLDGGHITFVGIEAIIGKPVNAKIQQTVSLIGIALLMALMVFTFYNDIRRIFFNNQQQGYQQYQEYEVDPEYYEYQE